jgi:hypothetical protein
MTVLRNVTIACEGCFQQTAGHATVPEARRAAKALGWRQMDGPYQTKADLCPKCQGGVMNEGTQEIGTPVVTLGFSQDELARMASKADPDAIEVWLHKLVDDALFEDIPIVEEADSGTTVVPEHNDGSAGDPKEGLL